MPLASNFEEFHKLIISRFNPLNSILKIFIDYHSFSLFPIKITKFNSHLITIESNDIIYDFINKSNKIIMRKIVKSDYTLCEVKQVVLMLSSKL